MHVLRAARPAETREINRACGGLTGDRTLDRYTDNTPLFWTLGQNNGGVPSQHRDGTATRVHKGCRLHGGLQAYHKGHACLPNNSVLCPTEGPLTYPARLLPRPPGLVPGTHTACFPAGPLLRAALVQGPKRPTLQSLHHPPPLPPTQRPRLTTTACYTHSPRPCFVWTALPQRT